MSKRKKKVEKMVVASKPVTPDLLASPREVKRAVVRMINEQKLLLTSATWQRLIGIASGGCDA